MKRFDCILVYGSTTKGDVVKRSDCIPVYGSTTKGDVVMRSDCIHKPQHEPWVPSAPLVSTLEQSTLLAASGRVDIPTYAGCNVARKTTKCVLYTEHAYNISQCSSKKTIVMKDVSKLCTMKNLPFGGTRATYQSLSLPFLPLPPSEVDLVLSSSLEYIILNFTKFLERYKDGRKCSAYHQLNTEYVCTTEHRVRMYN